MNRHFENAFADVLCFGMTQLEEPSSGLISGVNAWQGSGHLLGTFRSIVSYLTKVHYVFHILIHFY